MYVDVIGTGPVVFIESGLGGGVREWDAVAAQLSATCTVIRRLRPGLADGAPVGTRDADIAAKEIAEILSDYEGPHLLVGHSLGALYVRAYAAQNTVAGLVLVDPSAEQALTRDPGMMAGFAKQSRLMNLLLHLGIPGRVAFRKVWLKLMASQLTDPHTEAARATFAEAGERMRKRGVLRALKAELDGISDSMRQVEPPAVPVRVLTQGLVRTKPDEVAMLERWQGFHAELAASSPDGTQTIVDGCGHLLPLEAPDAIVAAVRELVP